MPDADEEHEMKKGNRIVAMGWYAGAAVFGLLSLATGSAWLLGPCIAWTALGAMWDSM